MRRIVRGVLWVVKGVLLAIALGALVVWPWSYEHSNCLSASRLTRMIDRDEYQDIQIAWKDGRIGVMADRAGFSGPARGNVGPEVIDQNAGWETEFEPENTSFAVSPLEHSLGPLFWGFLHSGDAYHWEHHRIASIPCWLLALIAAAWPLISLALHYRRRARRRHLARVGCCTKCGYDLRATPRPGGDLLTRCPECGTPTVLATPS
jgi:hypothetical protein